MIIVPVYLKSPLFMMNGADNTPFLIMISRI